MIRRLSSLAILCAAFAAQAAGVVYPSRPPEQDIDAHDPARLVFSAPAGPAINVLPIDMGNRFRMIVNEVGAAAWIPPGGALHTVYSQQVDMRHIEITRRIE